MQKEEENTADFTPQKESLGTRIVIKNNFLINDIKNSSVDLDHKKFKLIKEWESFLGVKLNSKQMNKK